MSTLKGTDFIEDGFLDKAIADMERLKKSTVDAMQTIRQEAATLEKSVQGVSAAQKDGQKVVEDAEKRTQDLIKAQSKYSQSLDETEVEIVRLKAAQQEQNRVNKLTEKFNRSAEGSYDKLSAQYSLNKIKLNQMSEAQRKGTKDGKKLEESTKGLFEQMKSLQEATGKHTLSVGDYAGKVGELIPSIGSATEAAKGFGAQLWALVKHPIVLIVVAIVVALRELWEMFKQNEQGARQLERITATLTTTFSTLRAQIGKLLSGQLSWKNLISDTTEELAENVKAALELVDAERKLEKQTADTAQAQARLEKEIAKVAIIRDNDAKSLPERQRAARAQAELEKKLSQERVNQALNQAEVVALSLRKETQGTEAYRLAQNELTKAIAEVTRAQAEQIRVNGEAATQLEMIRLDIFEQELDLLLDITDRRKTVNERQIADESLAMEERKRLAQENVDIIEDAFNKQIESFNELNGVQLDQVKIMQMTPTEVLKYAQSLGFAERTINRLREVIIEKQAADQDNLETLKSLEEAERKLAMEEKARAEQANKDYRNGLIERVNQQKELRLSEIELLKDTEEEKTRLALEAEKRRLRAIININKTLGGELSKIQIQTMENTIKSIDQKLADLSGSDDHKDIFDYLGLKLSDEEKEGVNATIGYLKESITSLMQSRLDAINRIVEARNIDVENARNNLEAQVALQEAGEEADIQGAVRVLKAKEEQRDRALKQQRRAQRAQQRLAEAESLASLIAASANIFKATSKIPPPFGQIAAVAAIGTMFAAFASAKASAAQSAKFGKGGSFDVGGGSHASGNDTSLGIHGGVDMRVERGEKVGIFSRKALRKYGGARVNALIDALNAGEYVDTFTGLDSMPDYLTKAESGGVSLERYNAELRRDITRAIKEIPQPILNIDEAGFNIGQRLKNTTHSRIINRNKYK